MDTQVERLERLELAGSRAGRVLGGKFRLLRLLGIGGTAAVYEAQHRNGKRVALKVLHTSLDSSLRQRERFLREAYVANTIAHPGVVQIFDDGVDASGAVYLVMELLEGATLADLQKAAGGRLELGLAIDAADQLLDVLAVAHASGVVHRDIKPANLFVTRTGQLKVLDFGIARVFEPSAGSALETQSGAMLGTPAFMPQEQARGRWDEVEARSDLWAVGATLFTLLSGEHVHRGDTPNEQLGRAMTTPARSLAALRPQLPSGCVEVIDRALRFERQERWPDARSMQGALRDATRAMTGVSDAASIAASDAWARVVSTQHASFGQAVTTLSAAAATDDAKAAAARPRAVRSARPSSRLAAFALVALIATGVVLSFELAQRGAEHALRGKLPTTAEVVAAAPAPAPKPIAEPVIAEVSEPLPAPRALTAPRRQAQKPARRLREPPSEPAPSSDPLDLRY